MEAYGAAKARLFGAPGLAPRVINVDDPFGERLAREASGARLTVTTRAAGAAAQLPGGAQFVRAARITPDPGGLSIEVESSFGSVQLPVRLMGAFNADNALTVLAGLPASNTPSKNGSPAPALTRPGTAPTGDSREPSRPPPAHLH